VISAGERLLVRRNEVVAGRSGRSINCHVALLAGEGKRANL
jgi:hypothetical protein